MGGRGWPGGLVASWPGHSSRLTESGRLVRRMSHHVDPAAIAEEARTVRLDAVLGPPRRSVPVGDSSTPESRTLTPLIMVRILFGQPVIKHLIGNGAWVEQHKQTRRPDRFTPGEPSMAPFALRILIICSDCIIGLAVL